MLTKSLFNLSIKCPTKVYYKRNQYRSQIDDNEYLEALAEGGFQVGELARCYYPEGIVVEEQDFDEAFRITQEKLSLNEQITLFEAALKLDNLGVRVDILKCDRDCIHLIEVKSKSFSIKDDLFTKNGAVRSKWGKYFLDIAFQSFVASKLFPGKNLKAYLYLIDKSKICSIDGLNTLFKIEKNGPLYSITRETEMIPETLGNHILTLVDVTDNVNEILNLNAIKECGGSSLNNYISELESSITSNQKFISEVGKKCKDCEFKSSNGNIGFRECWESIFQEHGIISEDDLIYNIWDYRNVNKDFQKGIYSVSELAEEEFTSFEHDKKLDRKERQWLQLKSMKDGNADEFVYKEGLREYFESWKFPYHLIDFETSRVALPFRSGQRPYQAIAFQFSHHIIDDTWSINHAGEFIDVTPNSYPNFEFIRALKQQLGEDEGTVFMYHNYEMTILNEIKKEIESSTDENFLDKEELKAFIESLTRNGGRLVDLRKVVLECYYNPAMRGSNSLKDVLPAILRSTQEVQEKYSGAIYGTETLQSRNFENHVWIRNDQNGNMLDPYSFLGPIFDNYNTNELDRSIEMMEINNGSAAMMAYNRLQFSDVPDNERQDIRSALLKYCELDTFAMVLLLECWSSKL